MKSEMKNSDDKERFHSLVNILGGMLVIIVLFAGAAIWFFIYRTDCNLLDKACTPTVYSQFGAMGDFFGGILNPVFGFFTFMALLFTVTIQQRQLMLTREDLTLTRKELADSADALEAQRDIAQKQAEHMETQAEKEDLYRIINSVFLELTQALETANTQVLYTHQSSGAIISTNINPTKVLGDQKSSFYPHIVHASNDQSGSEAIRFCSPLIGLYEEIYLHLKKYETIAGNDDVSGFFKKRIASVCKGLNRLGYVEDDIAKFIIGETWID